MMQYRGEYKGYVERNGKFHEILIDFYFHVEKEGIGAYEYWGFKGYDETNCMIIDEIIGAYIVKSGVCLKECDIPSVAECKDVIFDRKTNEIKYCWNHCHEIDKKWKEIENIEEQAYDNYDFEKEISYYE